MKNEREYVLMQKLDMLKNNLTVDDKKSIGVLSNDVEDMKSRMNENPRFNEKTIGVFQWLVEKLKSNFGCYSEHVSAISDKIENLKSQVKAHPETADRIEAWADELISILKCNDLGRISELERIQSR